MAVPRFVRRVAARRRRALPRAPAAVPASSGRRTSSARPASGGPARRSSIPVALEVVARVPCRRWRAAATFRSPNGGLDDPPASSALEYEPVGSLAGTLRVKDRAVDFGASDDAAAVERARAAGARAVPARHRRRRRRRQHRRRRDRAAQADRPGARRYLPRQDHALVGSGAQARSIPSCGLPDAPIAVVHRSDGSGTTFNFTDYLSKVSPEWKQRGRRRHCSFAGRPAPARRATRASPRTVRARRNSIGYVEYAQARQSGLTYALLQNRAGPFVDADAGELSGRRGERRLGSGDGFPPPAHRRRRRGRLSDHRHCVRADATSRRRARGPGPRSISSAGRWSTGRPRRDSAMCRCRRRWWKRSRPIGPGPSRSAVSQRCASIFPLVFSQARARQHGALILTALLSAHPVAPMSC